MRRMPPQARVGPRRPRPRAPVAALVATLALTLTGAAAAGFASPALRVAAAGKVTTITLTVAPEDDATAIVSVYLPVGTRVAAKAPGTQLGTVKAQLALPAGGAPVLTGGVVTAAPGTVTESTVLECTQEAPPTATWLLQLRGGDLAPDVPAYLLPTAGDEANLGPAKLRLCFDPAALAGGRVLTLAITLTGGVVSGVTQGAWVALWTPRQPATGQLDLERTVASPAAVAPPVVTIRARRGPDGVLVSGRVTQGGVPRAGAVVTVRGGLAGGALARLGLARTSAAGAFSFRARRGSVFQAHVVAGPVAAPGLCELVAAQLRGLPCVNPTANGFGADSALARAR